MDLYRLAWCSCAPNVPWMIRAAGVMQEFVVHLDVFQKYGYPKMDSL